ncbi:uncharacterized protein LOC121367655 isoform X2 [Gigantopelta aegis]|uniref:uncharacterized protein LOC121367655 isoform X2 n=1 Tax=Gigantopelta aegis TaxID=1735272 RepID=UPI001B88C04E|nr:uncharacterized protein LOC121367655 isoform X2 [Gigantopelta aegis]
MRRRCLCFRLRTGFALFIMLLCLGCIFLTHRYISSSDSLNNRIHRSFPTLDKRKSLRFQAKSKQILFANRKDGRDTEIVQNFHLQLRDRSIRIRNEQVAEAKKFLLQLYPKDWAKATAPDEMALDLKHFLLDLGLNSNMSCKDIDLLQIGRTVAHSGRKYIERGQFDDFSRLEVTVKSQSIDIETKIECMKKIYDIEHCSPMGNYRMLREIFLLTLLKHSSVIQVLGYCIRGDRISASLRKKGLVLITEVGTPLTAEVIKVLPWHSRVMFASQLADLLDYLERNPLGSLGLGKVSLQDFVLVDDQDLDTLIKLVDLDDLQLTEKPCSYDTECDIANVLVGLKCVDGFCEGYNAVSNLHKLYVSILGPLLRNTRSAISGKLNRICEDLSLWKLTAQDLFNKLQSLLLDQGIELQDDQVHVKQEHKNVHRHHKSEVHAEVDDPEMNRPSNSEKLHRDSHKLSGHSQLTYIRYDESNYPGLYDFTCKDSRVLWGCVRIVQSLDEAKLLCEVHTQCRSFVVFSSEPETENKMTVVLKNSMNTNPILSSDTTLFVKQGREHGSRPRIFDNKDRNQKPTMTPAATQKTTSSPSTKESKLHARVLCVQKTLKNYQEARRSREKRLMAHMGLKGVRESDWRKSIQSQRVGSYKGLIASTGQNPQGGKFLIQFAAGNPDEPVTRAMFISEKGPDQFHVAQAITYQIDRLLGLYHTPPTITGRLTPKTVAQFSSDHIWKSHFSPILQSDGSLKGLFSVPMPLVMKPEPLALQPLKMMVKSIKKFNRQLKLQLEYVLLWGFAKISKPSGTHIGYKDHLIHFDADQAFQDLSLDISGYLYHCQFPNVVYKSLACFRCTSTQTRSQPLSSVCSLGQEVIERSREDDGEEEINVKDRNETQVVTAVNDAATSILGIVDTCVKQFGKDQVVY